MGASLGVGERGLDCFWSNEKENPDLAEHTEFPVGSFSAGLNAQWETVESSTMMMV